MMTNKAVFYKKPYLRNAKISIVYEEYLYHKIKQNTIKIGELVMISLQFNRLSKLRRRNCTYTIANKILIDIFAKYICKLMHSSLSVVDYLKHVFHVRFAG